MNSASLSIGLFLALIANTVAFAAPQPLDMDAASAEVSSSYGKAEPEVQGLSCTPPAHSVAAACG